VNTDEVSFLKNVKVLPNPFTDFFEIELFLLEKTDLQIQIVDAEGKIVQNITRQDANENEKITIDAKDLSNGIYFAKILSKEEVLKSVKLLKVN